MFGYHSRLKGDLARWRTEGWISPELETKLQADALAHRSGIAVSTVVGLLGAALLGFAVIAFVAANWDGLSKLTRLVVLFGALWATYGVTFVLHRTRHPIFAELALLVGGVLFGANIMLIAQTYHISGYTPDALLLWAVGVLLAAGLLSSTPSLVLAIGLVTLWIVWDKADNSQFAAWQALVAFALCAGLVWRQRSIVALHALLIGLIVWLFAELLDAKLQLWPLSLLGLAVCAAGLAGSRAEKEAQRNFLAPLAIYGALLAFGAHLGHQLSRDDVYLRLTDASHIGWMGFGFLAVVLAALAWRKWLAPGIVAAIGLYGLGLCLLALVEPSRLLGLTSLRPTVIIGMAFGALLLAASVWTIVQATPIGWRGLMVVGFLAFGAELLYIYFEAFGGLLSTSLFYLVAGLLLI
ncbi:MAG: DUF2157 domain-containing protein, partial [Parvibaculaceae bacterium]